MKCKDIMSKNIICCHKSTKISKVIEIMTSFDIGFIPIVIEDTGFVCGIITDRDIITRFCNQNNSFDDEVSKYMTLNYISVNEDDDVSIGISKMADNQIKRIIVTNRYKQITGVISIKDIALNKYTNVYLNDLLSEICL